MPTNASVRHQYATALHVTNPVIEDEPRTFLWRGSDYIKPGTPAHDLLNAPVSLFATKYIPGSSPVVTAPLWLALLDCHDQDVHFAMYSSLREVRCVKTESNPDLTFHIAAIDMDYGGTASGRQTTT